MSKAKKDINQNFEMLKAQMQAKRQKAEKQSEDDSKINTEVIDIKDNAKDEEFLKDENEIAKKKEIKDDIPITEETSPKSEVKATPKVEVEEVKKTPKVEIKEVEEIIEEPIVEENETFEEQDEEIIVRKKRSSKAKPKKKVVEVFEDDFEDDFYEDDLVTTTSSGAIKIKIKKQEKPEAPRRATYYLKQETIRKIEKVSKMSGIGKSKLVQLLLDQALDNLEIEK